MAHTTINLPATVEAETAYVRKGGLLTRQKRVTGYRADLVADSWSPPHAYGETAAEAKAALTAHVMALVTAQTRVITFAGYVAILRHTGESWAYALLTPQETDTALDCAISARHTYRDDVGLDEVRTEIRRHIAQLVCGAYTDDAAVDRARDWLADAGDDAGVRDLDRRGVFQRAYALAIREGMSSECARDLAFDAPHLTRDQREVGIELRQRASGIR